MIIVCLLISIKEKNKQEENKKKKRKEKLSLNTHYNYDSIFISFMSQNKRKGVQMNATDHFELQAYEQFPLCTSSLFLFFCFCEIMWQNGH